MEIRDAVSGDLPDIQAIYAHHVLHGTGTFEEVPPDLDDMAARLADVRALGCPWLVAEGPDGIVGYGYYTRFRNRSAYRFTVEDSIYVRNDVRGQGVGKALGAELLRQAQARGFRQMIAVIGDADNTASIGVHASLGFQSAGRLRNVAFKFGRWLDAVLMQVTLGEGVATLPDGDPFQRGGSPG
jgi:L-amino acid N-acyltransferase YncA